MIEKPYVYQSSAEVPAGAQFRDLTQGAKRELFFILHPELKKDSPEVRPQLEAYMREGGMGSVWVYYPWLHFALRIPDEQTYWKLRTARNRDLITPEEQAKFRDGKVGIAGLSVGSSALASIVQTGGPRKIKIADPDVIEMTNLNRMRAALADVGSNKADIAALEAWEVDPFLDIEIWRDGIREGDAEKFLLGLDVFIDEMDSIPMKVLTRNLCKKMQIPVVMATDNGDGLIMDIERFDLEPDRPIFHGRIEITDDELKNIDRAKFVELANKIIDPKKFTKRQWASIKTIGKVISGVPQLGTAASMAGAAVAYCVRQIILGPSLQSGRYTIDPEKSFKTPKA